MNWGRVAERIRTGDFKGAEILISGKVNKESNFVFRRALSGKK